MFQSIVMRGGGHWEAVLRDRLPAKTILGK